MAQKVWVITRIECFDGEISYDQEIEKDRPNAECRWGEKVDDITEYLHNNCLDEFADEKYDAENLYYEMRHNDDFALVFGEEFEV